MNKVFGLLLFAGALFLSVPGCSESGPSNIAEDADQSAVEQYELNQAASQAELEAAGAEAATQAPPE
jgi:hypothetical protein